MGAHRWTKRGHLHHDQGVIPMSTLPVMYRHTQLGNATTKRGALRVARKLSKQPFEHHTAQLADRYEDTGDDFLYRGKAWFVGVALGKR